MQRTLALLLTLGTISCAGTGSPAIEGFATVNGGRVWYRRSGEKSSRAPLLVLHGGPGATHDYLSILEELNDQREVILYDQLGAGRSDRPDDTTLWTVERFVDEVQALREALQLEQVHILGQSWGAMLAVEYASRPEAKGIMSLVLSGPLLNSKLWTADAKRYVEFLPPNLRAEIESAEQAGNYESEGYQKAMNEFYKRHLCRLNPWPDNLNQTFEKMNPAIYEQMWGPSEFTVTGTLKDADTTQLLPLISLPVLFTAGEYDEAAPETVRLFHGMTKNSRLVVFKDCSHEHHLERPKEYLNTVREFLASADNID